MLDVHVTQDKVWIRVCVCVHTQRCKYLPVCPVCLHEESQRWVFLTSHYLKGRNWDDVKHSNSSQYKEHGPRGSLARLRIRPSAFLTISSSFSCRSSASSWQRLRRNELTLRTSSGCNQWSDRTRSIINIHTAREGVGRTTKQCLLMP